MNRTTGGSAKWWMLGLGLVVAVPAFCCCGMSMLGALSPAAPSSSGPRVSSTVPAEPSAGSTVPAEPDREPSVNTAAPSVVANEERAEVEGDGAPGLPGIGATRAHWEATHQRAPGFTPGMAFGPMFRSENGRSFNPTYAMVSGDDRIQSYSLQLPSPGVAFDVARARVLRELPPDAREVRTRRLSECRMVRYRSATLRRLFAGERHRGDVEVSYFSPGHDAFDPRRVTFFTVTFYVSEDIRC